MSVSSVTIVSYGTPIRHEETARIEKALREQDERDELLRQQRLKTQPSSSANGNAHG